MGVLCLGTLLGGCPVLSPLTFLVPLGGRPLPHFIALSKD